MTLELLMVKFSESTASSFEYTLNSMETSGSKAKYRAMASIILSSDSSIFLKKLILLKLYLCNSGPYDEANSSSSCPKTTWH